MRWASSTNITTWRLSACFSRSRACRACITSSRPAPGGRGSFISKAMACRMFSGERLGLARYTTSIDSGSFTSSMRQIMVLPLPTSPMTLMIPSPLAMA